MCIRIPNEIADNAIKQYVELFCNILKDELPREYKQLITNHQYNLVQNNSSQLQMLIGYSLDVSSIADINQYLINNTFKPHINLDFFCVDDPIFKDRFATALNSQVINIKAHNKEEALYCVLNELNRINSKREVIIVNDQKTWKYFISHPHENCIYIPNFIDDEIPLIPGNKTIYIYSYNQPIFKNVSETIELRPRRNQTVVNCLEKAGMSYVQAYDLVNKSHGMFINIKRKLFIGQKNTVPDWVSNNDKVNVILTAMLMNEWTDQIADQYIIKELCNVEYKDFINALMPFIVTENPLVCKRDTGNIKTYYLSDTEIVWGYLNEKLKFNNDLWNKFIEIIKKVETSQLDALGLKSESTEQFDDGSFFLEH